MTGLEKASFSGYAAAISTSLYDFVVAKVDQACKVQVTNGFDRVDLARVMLFASAFLPGMLCTFIGRLYLGTRSNTQSSAPQGTDGK